jgi:hypothetical protein
MICTNRSRQKKRKKKKEHIHEPSEIFFKSRRFVTQYSTSPRNGNPVNGNETTRGAMKRFQNNFPSCPF